VVSVRRCSFSDGGVTICERSLVRLLDLYMCICVGFVLCHHSIYTISKYER
jgi:hypothetical protein